MVRQSFNQWLEMEGFNEMVSSVWKSSQFLGSASFILKEKLKSLKTRIKMWREHNCDVGAIEVKEAKDIILPSRSI